MKMEEQQKKKRKTNSRTNGSGNEASNELNCDEIYNLISKRKKERQNIKLIKFFFLPFLFRKRCVLRIQTYVVCQTFNGVCREMHGAQLNEIWKILNDQIDLEVSIWRIWGVLICYGKIGMVELWLDSAGGRTSDYKNISIIY